MTEINFWRAEMRPQVAAILGRHAVGPGRLDEAAAHKELGRHYRAMYGWWSRDEPDVGQAWEAEVRAQLTPAFPGCLEDAS